MSLSASLFGSNSAIHKITNVMGLGIPGWLDKQMNPGTDPVMNSLGELSQQTAEEGGERPIVWGRVRPIGGNIIYCQEPIKKWVMTKVDAGGKGGSKKKEKQYTEHVYRTYAVGVCEGPITAFRRIWRNNKLVYDNRGTPWGGENNEVFLRSFRLYTGRWDQMPDPDLESIWGIGDVSAHRGTAYMVSVNEDLTELGGSVPQFIFEVERAEGVYYTSKLFGVEEIEGQQISGAALQVRYNATLRDTGDIESQDIGGEAVGIRFGTVLIDLDSGFEEHQLSGEALEINFNRNDPLRPYDAGFEEQQMSGAALSIRFKQTLVTYSMPEPDEQQMAGEALSIRFGTA